MWNGTLQSTISAVRARLLGFENGGPKDRFEAGEAPSLGRVLECIAEVCERLMWEARLRA